MSDNPVDPLDSLVVNGDDLDRQLLADLVAPFAALHLLKGVMTIRYTQSGDSLSAREKVLVFLLSKKALALKDPTGKATETASPTEIEKETGIAGGTLRPALRKLADDNLLVQDSKGGAYSVPNFALNRIKSILPVKKGG